MRLVGQLTHPDSCVGEQVVLFHEGRYCAVVHVSGDYNQVPLSAALTLARRIDGRIRAISSSS
jgi:hypothetical protein